MKVSEIEYKRIEIEKINQIYLLNTKKIKNAKTLNEVLVARNEIVNANVELETYFSLAYIRWSINTADEFYKGEKRYYEENIPKLSTAKTEYITAMLNSNFKEELKKRLPETLFPLFENELISSSPKIEDLRVEESGYADEYSNFMSSLLIEYNGEKIPLTILKKYMSDENREIRINAYNSLAKALEENSEFLDGIFDKLVKVRTQMGKALGYENFVKLGYAQMQRVAYSEKELSNLRTLIKKYIVPAVSEIRNDIKQKLGYKELFLYDYETVYNDNDPVPEKQNGELLKSGLELYESMSEDTAKFFKSMLENEAIDCLSRKNKWGGGYQTDLPKFAQPFILANFNGTSADADVLTHETGHAYASYTMSRNNADKEVGLPFMDVAETHSMSMEFLCWKYIDKIFGNNAKRYMLKHLVDSFTFLTYGTMVDEFQLKIYENYNLTENGRKDLWKSLENEYRPYISTKNMGYFDKGVRWQYQMHIYESPFYYIDYVLAQLTSLRFLVNSLENYGKTFENYKKFISLGADYDYLKALQLSSMPSPFDEKNIIDLVQKIKSIYYQLSKEV